MKIKKNKISINYIKAFLGLCILVYLIYYIEPQKLYETYLNADKFYLFIALFLLPLNIFLQFYKWKILSKEYFGISNNVTVLLSLFYGIGGGIFTPMKSGEFIARAIPYKNTKTSDVVIATMVDKFIPMYFILFTGGIFSFFYFYHIFSISKILIGFFTIIYFLIIITIPFLLLGNSSLSKKIKNNLLRIKYYQKIAPKISYFKNLDRKTFLVLILLSVTFNLIFTIQMTILLLAFSNQFNIWIFFVISNLIIFAQIIIPPIVLGELGIREGAAVFFMTSFGFAGAVGFNAAFSLFIINLLLPTIIGFFLLSYKSQK